MTLQKIQHRILRRNQRKIMPSRRPHEISRRTGKRSCDHTSHPVLSLQDFSCNPAVFIKLLRRDKILMSRNLEHTVRRRIDDQSARFQMFLSIAGNDLRTGIGFVAKNLPSCFLLKFPDHPFRESIRIDRQRPFRDQACNFPVTNGRILPSGLFLQSSIGAKQLLWNLSFRCSVDRKQAKAFHCRNPELFRLHDGLQCIGSPVSEIVRIRLITNPEAVQHDQKNSAFHLFYLLSVVSRIRFHKLFP